MLSALRESGYSVTVVSNTTHEEVRAWNSCELANLIEDPVFSFEVGAMKPEPAIHAEALRRVGCAASEAVSSVTAATQSWQAPGDPEWNRWAT